VAFETKIIANAFPFDPAQRPAPDLRQQVFVTLERKAAGKRALGHPPEEFETGRLTLSHSATKEALP
jgi:hypothetical protein